METKSHEVRVWCPIGKSTRLYRKQPGHRGQPDQDKRYRVHEATQVQEGPDEAHRVHGCFEPIHHPARRQRLTRLQTSLEV